MNENERPKFWTVGAIVAALVILLCAGWIIFKVYHNAEALHDHDSSSLSDDLPPSASFLMQSKLIVALAPYQRGIALDEAEKLVESSVGAANRRGLAVVFSYLDEKERAIEFLDQNEPPSELDRLVRRAIEESAGLSSTEREALLDQMGWFGKMQLAEIDSEIQEHVSSTARGVLLVVGGFAVTAVLALFAGFALLAIGVYLFYAKALQFQFKPENSPHAPIYLEAFAVYMASMIGMSLAAIYIPDTWHLPAQVFAIFFAGFIGMIWPVLRGVPFSTVRGEIGLTRGRGFFRELGAGLLGYLAILPLLLLGSLGMALLWWLLKEVRGSAPPSPNHPAGQMIADSGLRGVVLLFLTAAVAAPIVEEIMFRGVLQRALRFRLSRWLALPLMGLIFAAIHPQGIIAIPALAAIGIGFGLIREWRDSIVGTMAMHAVHNGTILAITVTML